MISYLSQQLFNTLALAGIYALVSLGVTLIFGLTGLVNFAHGEVLMLGAYVLFVTVSLGGGYVPGLMLAAAATAVLGYVMERFLFRHTLSRPINGFIISLGLIAVLQNIAIGIFTVQPRLIDPPVRAVWDVADIRVSAQRVITVAVAAMLLGGYYLFTSRSRIGRALRACNQNRQAASLLGIPTQRIVTLAFVLGSALAGIGGGLFAALVPVSPDLGGLIIVKAFVVALIGGLGSTRGIVAASLLLAAIETFLPGTVIPAEWTPALAFVVMVAVLLVRPQGIFRGTEGSSVV